MRLRQLECFKAVMVAGTMTAAAKRIGTSQPGVSNLIASLEHEIGFRLFERQKGRLVPTPEANQFYQSVERIVSGVEDVRRTAKQISEGKHGSLTIAALPGFGLSVLPAVISDLRNDRPGARFKILTRSTDAVRMMIPSQQCDIAIVETPMEELVEEVEVLRFECVAAMPEDHPLTVHDVLTPELIRSEPLITLYHDHPTTLQIQRSFFAGGLPWDPIVESRFFVTNCELVARGAGISIIDPLTADQYLPRNIAVRRYQPRIVHEIMITLPGDGPHSRLAVDFVQALKDKVQPYLLNDE